jgi:diguanylate cyclase (GGDEF)-like protein/PAS domain S-box-containing protein
MRFARQMLRRLAGRGPRPDDAIVVDGHVIPYRSLVEELPAMVYVDTAQDGFANVYVSPFSEQLTGYTPAEWRSDPEMFQKVLHPDDRDMLELEESSEGVQHEYRLIARDGREVWVRDTYVVVSADDGTPLLVQGVMQDITDRKRAEEQARSSERLFRDILEEVHLLAVIIDTDGRVVFCNDYMLEVLGWKREDLLGRRLSETIIAPDLRAAGRAEFLEAMKTGVIKRHGDVRVVTRDDEERIVSYNSTLMLGEDGTPSGMTTIAEDVTERRHAEERVQYLASYDQLTGLPNRTLFASWLDMALGCAAEQLRVVGVQFVSLDEFRLINSSLGHAAGDALMGMFADRLREAATGAELVARQGGDEFLILLADVDEETGEDSTHAVAADVAQMAEALTGRLRALLSRPFRWEGHDIYLSATVGTAMYPEDADDGDGLIKQATVDCYRVRDAGKGFNPGREARAPARELELTAALHRAIDRSEFALHYQPVVHLATGDPTGVEALLRWTSAELGSVSPADFVPLAERTGLIEPITEWVAGEVCRQSQRWRERGMEIEIAFNFPTSMWGAREVARLLETLRRNGMRPGDLLLEVTETTAMSEQAETKKVSEMLREAGLPLAIDDFGTGYSSLSRLKALPASMLKVDRTFVRDVPGDADSAAMVTTIIQLARLLGLQPVAEGIETEAQRRFMLENGCQIGQGFLFSPAVTPGEVERIWACRGDVAA